MDDFMPASDPVLPSPEPGEAPSSGLKGFLSTTLGKIVVIGSALTLFVAIVGVVVFLVLGSLAKQGEQAAVDELNKAIAARPTPAATRTVETTGSAGNRVVLPVTNKDVFTARDPFEPVLRPIPQVVASSSVEATPKPADVGMLTLQDIVTNGGVLKAMLLWEGKQYLAAEGEVLKGTPWQVLSITKTTVTMLFGDVQVTLSIGEGIAKD